MGNAVDGPYLEVIAYLKDLIPFNYPNQEK